MTTTTYEQDLPAVDIITPQIAIAISTFLDELYYCFRAPKLFQEEFGDEKFERTNATQTNLGNISRARLAGMISATEGPVLISNAECDLDGKQVLTSPIVSVERIVHLRILFGHFAYNLHQDLGVYETFHSLTEHIDRLRLNMSAASLYKLVDRFAMQGYYWTDPSPKDERHRMIAPTRMATREWRLATVCYILGLLAPRQPEILQDTANFASRFSAYLVDWESATMREFGSSNNVKDFDALISPPPKFDPEHHTI
jgi:hypothetical protein